MKLLLVLASTLISAVSVSSQVIDSSIDAEMELNENGLAPQSWSGSDPISIDNKLMTSTGSVFEIDTDYKLFNHKAMLNFDIHYDGSDTATGNYRGRVTAKVTYVATEDCDGEVLWDFEYIGPNPFGLQIINIFIDGSLYMTVSTSCLCVDCRRCLLTNSIVSFHCRSETLVKSDSTLEPECSRLPRGQPSWFKASFIPTPLEVSLLLKVAWLEPSPMISLLARQGKRSSTVLSVAFPYRTRYLRAFVSIGFLTELGAIHTSSPGTTDSSTTWVRIRDDISFVFSRRPLTLSTLPQASVTWSLSILMTSRTACLLTSTSAPRFDTTLTPILRVLPSRLEMIPWRLEGKRVTCLHTATFLSSMY